MKKKQKQSKSIYQSNYCRPLSVGIMSEPRPVGKRLAKLLDALSDIHKNICEGELVDQCEDLRRAIFNKLKEEGWRVTYKKNNACSVLPPKGY